MPFGTGYRLDGANHLNFLTGVSMPIPFPDAAQEFKVEASGLGAQHGNASSVEVVTRSGTNELHGTLFEFLRNDTTSAREYFTVTQSTLKRNQFGGTVGGPIKKDRLFFFGGFEGTTLRADPANQIAFIATSAMIQGDWRAFASPACNGRPITLRGAGWVNNVQTNPANFSRAAVFMAQKILESQPTPPNDCGQVTYGTPSHDDVFQYTGKLDYHVNDNQSLFFRGLATNRRSANSFSLGEAGRNLLNSTVHGSSGLAQSYAVGHTYVMSPNMVNAARFSFNRISTTLTEEGTNKSFSFCDAGVNTWCGATEGVLGSVALRGAGGGFLIGIGVGGPLCCGDHWTPTNYAVNDDVSFVHGAHQLAFGVGGWRGTVSQSNHFAPTGAFIFSSAGTGMAMGDFFMGNVARFFQGLVNTHEINQSFVDAYFTDTWKVNQRLTVNLGLRWEPFLPQDAANGAAYNFDMDRFLAGTRSTAFVNAPAGFYYPGDPGFPGKSGIHSQWAHFAPRVGLAWDPTGGGKTSFRASSAYGYAFLSGIWREDASGSNPWGGRTVLSFPGGGFDNPWQGVPGGNPLPYVVDKNARFTPRGLFLTQDYDIRTPTTYTWNLSLQRQLGESWLASATYLGTRTQHLGTQNAINPAQIIPSSSPLGVCPPGQFTGCNATTNIDGRRLLSLLNRTEGEFIGPMAQFDDGGTQSYHGMLLSLQRRLNRGVSLNGNWTWSHCIGVFSDINSTGPPADETYTMPNNRNFDRGNCLQDRRHLVNLTFVVQTPRFSNGVVGRLASGWQVSGIYRFSSGSPIAVVEGTDRALTGVTRQRPDQVLPNAYLDDSGKGETQYLNPAAFASQPFGTLGNVGWNSLVTPSTWNFDMGLSRQFSIQERARLEVRAEAFNITNSYRANPPTTGQVPPAFVTATNANFGKILSALAPRIMQFALKFTF